MFVLFFQPEGVLVKSPQVITLDPTKKGVGGFNNELATLYSKLVILCFYHMN